jgi:gamma-glutamyltranspeptidase / glutathione hydrolase
LIGVFTTRPELTGTLGMVASTHWLASSAGMAVLESGGNAFDAAVAAGFVLQVVEPHLNGPAGELPGIFATATDPVPRVLCAQGVAPAAATTGHFRDLGLDLVPGSGLLPATVPGAWDGWLTLLRDHGTKSLREVLSYAIGYARNGFPLVDRVPAAIGAVAGLFTEHWPSSAELWLPGGAPPVAKHTNPVLADTWERLIRESESASGDREAQLDAARRAWYQGFVAEAIDSFCRKEFRDSSGRDHAGLLTGEDLARWHATYEAPLTVRLGDWTVAKCGAWSQGPVLLQQLLLLEGFADELSYVDGVPTARTIHLAAECAKLAFADREAYYGDDPDVPIATLLSRTYAAERRKLVGDTASLELRPGSPNGRTPKLPAFITEGRGIMGGDEPVGSGLGEPTVASTGATRGDTVHLDVVDAQGNIVSLTPSGGWLQSSPAIPGLGFCLGTRGQMFWLEDGLPNSLAPGKRPRTTLSPSLALHHDRPRLAFGTPGGDQQDQWQLAFWLAHTVGGLSPQAAIDAPAWHSGAFPSSFYPRGWHPGELAVESRVGPDVLDTLAGWGHRITDAGPWALGRLSAAGRDPATGLVHAAANPRGNQGYAVGR